jgi:hypothetical protein
MAGIFVSIAGRMSTGQSLAELRRSITVEYQVKEELSFTL